MAGDPEKNGSPLPALVDPHGVHIQYIDSLVTLGLVSDVANLVVGTRHIEPRADGAPQRYVAVAARLRFTRPFAQQLRDQLDRMLTGGEKDSSHDPGHS